MTNRWTDHRVAPRERNTARGGARNHGSLASQLLIRPVDYPKSVGFYRDQLGLAIAGSTGTVFYAGQSLIEIAGGHHTPAESGMFPGALWLQVRDVSLRDQAELESRGVQITRARQHRAK